MRNIETKYNPKDIEKRIYQNWMDKEYFKVEIDKSKKPFTIVMPPPNVTGKLHMGHAFDNTIQDILIRYKRMQGFNCLWQSGTDHAAIATEIKVLEMLDKEKGLRKPELKREVFLEHAFKWKEEYGGLIISQLKKLGCSCDWSLERFTMDEVLTKAVKESFVRLYNKGDIYKGSRMINWCPNCKTSISDSEVEHKERNDKIWEIKYKVKDSDEFLVIATTRPETIPGDTAVAINPEDDRYKHLHGKKVILPIFNREIPIVCDEHANMEFGTGVVKITPAHDPNDYEVGKRHNLEELNILNDDATLNENATKDYEGLSLKEARIKILSKLEELGALVSEKDIKHNVGFHDRCGCGVEPLIKEQWFIKMEELAKPAIKAIETGELEFVPKNYEKTYLHWLHNIKDWCISRKLWWGHRIPVFTCDDCGFELASVDDVVKCEKCGSNNIIQDEHVLDTWYSSALWPFATLGWPEKTDMYDHFYPTDCLVTGYDIIFNWVVRMMFSAYEFTGKSPFKKVIIHGLIRDEQGRKMSKSLGNGVDPLEVIENYGTDALRMSIMTGISAGNDTRFIPSKVEACRNFANKVWNASRFIMLNSENFDVNNIKLENLEISDKWVLTKYNTLVKEVTENIDNYDLGVALTKMYDFIWDVFCDWYIEVVKPRLQKEGESKNAALSTLIYVLSNSLKLLHPYIPFITEEIYTNLLSKDTIVKEEWPVYKDELNFEKEEDDFSIIIDTIKGIRNVRRDKDVKNSVKTDAYIEALDEEINRVFELSEGALKQLGFINNIIYSKIDDTNKAASIITRKATIYIPLNELIDPKEEYKKIEEEEKKILQELERSNKILGNENFIKKAKKEKIEEEQNKKTKYEEMLKNIQERLEELRKEIV